MISGYLANCSSDSGFFEIELLPGLKEIVYAELAGLNLTKIELHASPKREQIIFKTGSFDERLFKLRSVVAIYQIHVFDIARPKALLGNQNLKRLVSIIQEVIARPSFRDCKTFRISMAGKDSSVMKRVIAEISKETSLNYDSESGELLLRIRRSVLFSDKWEILVRLTARPLSSRAWRICDMPGALNASIAAAMIILSRPTKEDSVLNLMSGSGTLAIERAFAERSEKIVAGDIDAASRDCCQQNITAAKLLKQIELVSFDAAKLPFCSEEFDVILVDPPWGERWGKRDKNLELYKDILIESNRIATSNARLLIITQDKKALSAALSLTGRWTLKYKLTVYQGGYHPSIFLLENPD